MQDQDKAEIVEFLLKNYYIKENEALQEQVNYLQVLLFDRNRTIEAMQENINNLNRTIARVQSDILYYQRLINNVNNHITYDDVYRTLGFDDSSESDTESEDLLSQLMG